MKTTTTLPNVEVSEATRQAIRKYAKLKRIEKRLSDKLEATKARIMEVSATPCNLVFQEEKLAKIIQVEKAGINCEMLKTNFSEVYERVKTISSHYQLRIA